MIRKILLIIDGTLLALSLLIGISYAYFLANVKYINHTETVILSDILNLVFTDSKEVVVSDIIPGDSVTKTFKVENISDKDTSYNILFRETTNEFNEDLVYELYEGENLVLSETVLPKSGTTNYMKLNIPIKGAETKEYTLKITFLYKEGVDQNINQGKNFKSTIEINSNQINSEIKTATNYLLAKNTISEDSNTLDGLIKTNDTYNNEPSYYFKGNVNNNVSFANSMWKIIRINEDGSIRIIKTDSIMDSTYNDDSTIENSFNYTGSGISSKLNGYYNNDLSDYHEYIIPQRYCNEFKVTKNDYYKMSETNVNHDSYTANLKCSESSSIKLNVGLISYDELSLSGLNYNTINYSNYLSNMETFTMSPAGLNLGNYFVWGLNSNGSIMEKKVSDTLNIRPVVNIKGTLNLTGDGTLENPYTFSL